MAQANLFRLILLGVALLAWGCSGTSSGKIGKDNIAKTRELDWVDGYTWYLPGKNGMAKTYRFSTNERRLWADEWMSFPKLDSEYKDGKRVFTTSQLDRFAHEGQIVCRIRTSAHSLSIARGKEDEVRGFYLMEAQIQKMELVPDPDNSVQCDEIVERFDAQAQKVKTSISFYFGKRLNESSGRAGFVMMRADQQYFEKWSSLHPGNCLNLNGHFASKEDVANDIAKVFYVMQCRRPTVQYQYYEVIDGELTEPETVNVDGAWRLVEKNDEKRVFEHQLMNKKSLVVFQRVVFQSADREDQFIMNEYKLNDWGDLVVRREVDDVPLEDVILYRQMHI